MHLIIVAALIYGTIALFLVVGWLNWHKFLKTNEEKYYILWLVMVFFSCVATGAVGWVPIDMYLNGHEYLYLKPSIWE